MVSDRQKFSLSRNPMQKRWHLQTERIRFLLFMNLSDRVYACKNDAFQMPRQQDFSGGQRRGFGKFELTSLQSKK